MNPLTKIFYRLVGISSDILFIGFVWQWVVTGFKESLYLLALSAACFAVAKTIEKINN
jgi:hypothetical protein